MRDADRVMTAWKLQAFKEALRSMGDAQVIEAYEAATSTIDDAAMTIAADEMQRRHLDY